MYNLTISVLSVELNFANGIPNFFFLHTFSFINCCSCCASLELWPKFHAPQGSYVCGIYGMGVDLDHNSFSSIFIDGKKLLFFITKRLINITC
jgi:hypothetical protein